MFMRKSGIGLALLMVTMTNCYATEQEIPEVSKEVLMDTIRNGPKEKTPVNQNAPSLLELKLEKAFATHQYADVLRELNIRTLVRDPNVEDFVALARIHDDPKGDAFNTEKVSYYLHKSAELGHAEYQAILGSKYLNGSSTLNIEKDETKALYWFSKSANSGYDNGQYLLGEMHQNGWGTEVNIPKAIEWYVRSADNGNNRALISLGNIYHTGNGGFKDYQKAHSFYLRAAENGVTTGEFMVGYDHYWGVGAERNYEQAKYWFERSMNQGNVPAMTYLGTIQALGYTGKVNLDLAKQYMEKASNQGEEKAKEFLSTGCLIESLKVFDIALACSDRKTINESIVAAGGKRQQANSTKDIDVYDASQLISGATTLTVTYLNDVFVSAEYSVDQDTLNKLVPAMREKYNRPFSLIGTIPQSIGGLEIRLRETPLGGGRLNYTNRLMLDKMKQQYQVSKAKSMDGFSSNF